MKVLVTGVAGALGRLVGTRLVARGHSVIGIDRRRWPDAPEGVQMFQADIRKRAAEDVFRAQRPDGVIHMATVTHLTHRSPDRFRINLQGTRAIVEYCREYGVSQFVFAGRHTYYGAAADSPLYHTEEEPPLGIQSFPELADLVAADLYAGAALWRVPELTTAVLRLCYTLGPSRSGTLAAFLKGPRVPTVLGFDPLFHFIHEEDAASAIVTAIEKKPRGVFNVAGPPPVPLSVIIRETGREQFSVPEPALAFAFGRFGLPKLPRGAIEHIKYPVVIEAADFRRETGFQHAFNETETMQAFARAR